MKTTMRTEASTFWLDKRMTDAYMRGGRRALLPLLPCKMQQNDVLDVSVSERPNGSVCAIIIHWVKEVDE